MKKVKKVMWREMFVNEMECNKENMIEMKSGKENVQEGIDDGKEK